VSARKAEATVTYADTDPNGLASMLGALIEANLRANPGRAGLLRPSTVELTARDAEVSVSLRISPSGVEVANERPPTRVDLGIRASSSDLIALSAMPLRFGLPDPLRLEGRAIIGKLLWGQIRVSGLVRHPAKLSRLTRLLSVN
jgi:hypothetical protein